MIIDEEPDDGSSGRNGNDGDGPEPRA